MRTEPEKLWWTVDELAQAELPDMPRSVRRINERAKAWRGISDCARRRAGKGGGWEYHWSVLPLASKHALLSEGETQDAEPVRTAEEAWAEYEALPQSAKAKADERLKCLAMIDFLIGSGSSVDAAVGTVAERHNCSKRVVYGWRKMVDGVDAKDRLAYLVPRNKLAKRSRRVQVDPDFFSQLKNDYLRKEPTSFKAAYDRTVRVARNEGWEIPPLHAARRLYKARVSKITEVALRKGMDALKSFFPHQTRDKTGMHALEVVQGDYHRFDVFVRWPGEDNPVRPQGIFLSDVYSGKILAYRLALTANSHTVQLTIGDMVERFGIPEAFLLDNGREFAAKMISGGAPTRNRFKVLDEDIPGLIPLLGSEIIWATPYSGQSKPIERAFRDLCDRVSKHPACAGAYTGNTPLAKPENYNSRAVDLEEFKALLDVEVADHNARPNRRSQVAFGRSFDAVFEESFKTHPMRRATDAQRRLWLLGASGVFANRKNGEVTLYGNRYWSEWMYRVAGEKIVARFDPDNLHNGLHVYDMEGAYLGFAECLATGGFRSTEAANDLARRRKAFVKKAREAARAEKELADAEVAARIKAASPAPDGAPRIEAEVVQLAKAHPKAPRPTRRKSADADQAARVEAEVTRLQTRRDKDKPEQDAYAVFQEAQALIRLRDQGHRMTEDQERFLEAYTSSAEYRGFLRAYGGAGHKQKGEQT